MNDLDGTAAERLDQLSRVSDEDATAEWTKRQLVRALQSWAVDQDTLDVISEGREDY